MNNIPHKVLDLLKIFFEISTNEVGFCFFSFHVNFPREDRKFNEYDGKCFLIQLLKFGSSLTDFKLSSKTR